MTGKNHLKKQLRKILTVLAALVLLLNGIPAARAEFYEEARDAAYAKGKAAYDAAYSAMYSQWDPDAVMQQYAKEANITQQENFNATVNAINNIYDAANSFDGRLKYVVADAAAEKYGVLGGYGTSLFLSDSGAGYALREMAGTLLVVLELLADRSAESAKSNMSGLDLEPLKSENGYTLMRTHGTVRGILSEMADLQLNGIAVDVLGRIRDQYTPMNHVKMSYLAGDFDPRDPDQVEQFVRGREYYGKYDAIRDRIREWNRMSVFTLYQTAASFTIEGKPVLTDTQLENALDTLKWTIDLEEEDMRTVRAEGPSAIERLILQKGIGLTEEEISYLQSTWDTSAAAALKNYMTERKEIAVAAGKNAGRYENFIDILETIGNMSVTESCKITVPGAGKNYLYFLTDENQQCVSRFLYPLSDPFVKIGTDGSVSLSPKAESGAPVYEDPYHVVLDPTGHVLYRTEMSGQENKAGSVVWYDLTSGGNIFRKTYTAGIQYGDCELLELVRPDGQADVILRGTSISPSENEYFPDDIGFYYRPLNSASSSSSFVVFNTLTWEARDEWGIAVLTEQKDELHDERADMDETFILMESKLFYRSNGELFCDFTSYGGIRQIQQIGDYFWILSETGYFYVIDMNLWVQSEDFIRLDPDATYVLNRYGLFETDRDSTVTRSIAADGSVAAEYPGVDLRKDLHGFCIGNWKSGYYNLATGRKLSLSVIQGNFDRTVGNADQ